MTIQTKNNLYKWSKLISKISIFVIFPILIIILASVSASGVVSDGFYFLFNGNYSLATHLTFWIWAGLTLVSFGTWFYFSKWRDIT